MPTLPIFNVCQLKDIESTGFIYVPIFHWFKDSERFYATTSMPELVITKCMKLLGLDNIWSGVR